MSLRRMAKGSGRKEISNFKFEIFRLSLEPFAILFPGVISLKDTRRIFHNIFAKASMNASIGSLPDMVNRI